MRRTAVLLISVLAMGTSAAGAQLARGSFDTELDGFRIHYEVHGNGPVLMTLPNSWGLSLEGLRALYLPLEEHLTMVYFDPRGMGASGSVRKDRDMSLRAVRSDWDALRRHLGLDRVHVIGWSNGATNLIHLAAERPDSLESAIFLHTTARWTQEDTASMGNRYPDALQGFTELEKTMASPEIPGEEKDQQVRSFYLDVWFPIMFADRERGRAMLEELFRDAAFSWRHAQYASRDLPPPYDLRDRLPDVQTRSLVIAGRHDIVAPERVKEIQEGIPGAQFVVFENSGHFAPVEEPELFVRTVVAFVEGGSLEPPPPKR